MPVGVPPAADSGDDSKLDRCSFEQTGEVARETRMADRRGVVGLRACM